MDKRTPLSILGLLSTWGDSPDIEDDWDEVLNDLLTEHGEHPVRAFLVVLDNKDRHQELDPEEFAQSFKDRYRGRWDRFGKFAENEISERVDDGRVDVHELWNMLNGFVDWGALGESPVFSDYTEVKVFPDESDNSSVYVFEDE